MQDMNNATHQEGLVGSDSNERRGLLADLPMRGLVYHAVLYLGVILILLAVNLRMAPDALWVQWIALLWGIVLAWNGWTVLSARRREGQR